MGSTAWEIRKKLKEIDYEIIRINTIKKKYYAGTIHMDNRSYLNNHVDFYEKSGYNEFRRSQKRPER